MIGLQHSNTLTVGSAGRNLIISSMGLGGAPSRAVGISPGVPPANPPFTGVPKKGEVFSKACPSPGMGEWEDLRSGAPAGASPGASPGTVPGTPPACPSAGPAVFPAPGVVPGTPSASPPGAVPGPAPAPATGAGAGVPWTGSAPSSARPALCESSAADASPASVFSSNRLRQSQVTGQEPCVRHCKSQDTQSLAARLLAWAARRKGPSGVTRPTSEVTSHRPLT